MAKMSKEMQRRVVVLFKRAEFMLKKIKAHLEEGIWVSKTWPGRNYCFNSEDAKEICRSIINIMTVKVFSKLDACSVYSHTTR